jgi:hypothetical protein
MKSRRPHRQRTGRTWAHVNSPAGLIRRRARADAKREALAATLPPVYRGPDPGTVWRRVVVLDGADQVLMDAVLYVPLCSSRCDQLAGMIDGQRMDRMTTATEIAEKVRGVIGKRPSVRLLADMQREAEQQA